MKLLCSEVPAGVSGTLNFTLCKAQYFTAALPLLHLGIAQTSLNIAFTLSYLHSAPFMLSFARKNTLLSTRQKSVFLNEARLDGAFFGIIEDMYRRSTFYRRVYASI